MDYLLLLLAFVGHTSLWVAAFNRVHSTGISRRASKTMALLGIAMVTVVPLGFGLWFLLQRPTIVGISGHPPLAGPIMAYLFLCWGAMAASLAWWTGCQLWRRPPALLRHDRRCVVQALRLADLPEAERRRHSLLLRVPGNQTLHLDLAERALEIRSLPPRLDGLSIVHLSDVHFTGRVPKAYFQEVVRRSNQLEPDLVAVTGDLLDRSDLIDWLPDTLGRLESRHGVYFVLGNHDVKNDPERVRQTLTDCGLIDVGGRRVETAIRGEPVFVAGNELPWFSPAADLESIPNGAADHGPLRLALAHSPDQLPWAQARGIDLLLTGHTHGGQIRLPGIGPIITPSRTGVKYASGVFDAPPTVMHVSRGVSGEYPIRFHCPPEITRLVLRAPDREQAG